MQAKYKYTMDHFIKLGLCLRDSSEKVRFYFFFLFSNSFRVPFFLHNTEKNKSDVIYHTKFQLNRTSRSRVNKQHMHEQTIYKFIILASQLVTGQSAPISKRNSVLYWRNFVFYCPLSMSKLLTIKNRDRIS